MSCPEPHRMTFRVRYPEVDRLGQVHSSRYAVYFEIGRTEMLRQAGMTYRDLEDRGFGLVVVRLHVDFIAPIRYDDELTLETRVTRATGARIDHAYRLLRDDEPVAAGETTLACVAFDGEVRRLPDDLLELVAAAQRAGDGRGPVT